MPNFTDLSISKPLLQVIQELGYKKPTPIQEVAIPALLKGQDLIGQSKTGSGKTLAFAVPLLQKLESGASRQPHALILCPTRELCAQVAREIRRLGRRHPGLHVLILAGGQPLAPQARALEKGVHLIVATPGRCLDHLDRGSLELSSIKTLVLDEADRMLDMGFQDEMNAIMECLPEKRQTVFFSATFPKEIEEISKKYQHKPLRLTIQNEETESPLSNQIQQSIVRVESPLQKFKTLLACLAQLKPKNALIFCNLKTTVAEVADQLHDLGLSCGALYGDLEQRERDQVLALFKNQSRPFLVATDVAARGIDVADLDLVVNYDLPLQKESYVHRIGRTGRASRTGAAVTFVTDQQEKKLSALQRDLATEFTTLDLSISHDSQELADQANPPQSMQTLYVYGGRKDKLRPGDLLGALTGEAGGFNAKQIGKIEIHDFFSYVAVDQEIAKTACARLTSGLIKGRRFKIELLR